MISYLLNKEIIIRTFKVSKQNFAKLETFVIYGFVIYRYLLLHIISLL